MKIPKPFLRKKRRRGASSLANNNITWLPEKDAAKEKYGRLVAGRQPVDDDTVVVTIWYVYSNASTCGSEVPA